MPALLRAPWPARLTWLAMPFLAGPGLADALDPRSFAVRTVASVALWAGWAVGVVAVLVPRSVTLTALRLVAPAAVGATLWAAVVAPDGADFLDVVAVAWAALAAVFAFTPATGDCFVNGSSYGDERRMPLRPPGAVLLGPVEAAWAVAVGGLAAGPLLLAAREWVAGVVLTAAGLPIALVAIRALHGLARRWVVFVPGGVVLHDPLTMLDPVLLPRQLVTHIGAAPADDVSSALDITAGAFGLALEVRLREPAQVALVRSVRRRREADINDTRQLLFTPTRPGAVLAEARARRLPA